MSNIPWQKIFSFTGKDIAIVLASAFIIMLVNKVQVFSDRLSAILIALPFTSIIAMMWMDLDPKGKKGTEGIANHAESTFWFVLPTLPMFLILPWMLRNNWGFWPALGVNCLITIGLFWLLVVGLRPLGIDLMPKG